MRLAWFRSTEQKESFIYRIIRDLFDPLRRYNSELTHLLAAEEECRRLFVTLKNGKSAQELLNYFETMAVDEKRTADQRGKANLLLSLLYTTNIRIKCFTLLHDEAKAKSYREKAEQLLGNKNCVITTNIQRNIHAILLGGESQYALYKLTEYATTKEGGHLATFANKVLSYVYRKGLTKENFSIIPDQSIAKGYQQKAIVGLKQFEKELTSLVKKIAGSWFFKDNALMLLNRAVTTGNKQVEYQYARELEKTGGPAKTVLFYYSRAAQSTKETPLTFKTEGHLAANRRLFQTFESGDLEVKKDRGKSSHYRFKMALTDSTSIQNNHAKEIISQANKGDLVSRLQAGLYYLTGDFPDLDQAEVIFNEILPSLPRKISIYESQLFEKFCLKLGGKFEELFLATPSSYNFKLDAQAAEYLSKAVYYLGCLPKTSKKYDEIQFRIAHYQNYFQQDRNQASITFRKLSEKGDIDCAYKSIECGFKEYWQSHQKSLSPEELKIIIAYEGQNKSFFDTVTTNAHTKLVSKNVSAIILDLVRELKDYGQAYSTFIYKLEQLIEKVEEENKQPPVKSLSQEAKKLFASISHFDPELRNKFESLWRAPVSSDLTRNQTMLQAFLNFLVLIKNKRGQQDSIGYIAIIEKVYINYVTDSLDTILQHPCTLNLSSS